MFVVSTKQFTLLIWEQIK